MKKIILASLLCALGAVGTTATQAQSASHSDTMQTENKMDRSAAGLSNSYEGMWQGMLRTSEGSRRVVLEVSKRPNSEGLMGNMVTSAQAPYSVLVDNFTIQDNHVSLSSKTAGSAFEGTANRAMTEIKGAWTYQGKTLPLTLKRMDLTARDGKGNAYELQAQAAGLSRNGHDDEYVNTPYEQRRTPVFRIGPPRWFPWYEWTPRIGNQETPYGTYYW